jgi:hypothetical protein
MNIDDAWRAWRNQQTPKPRRRRFIHRLPEVKLDMTEARRWYVPRSELKK